MHDLVKTIARHRLIVMGAALLVAACQTTVSIEEAKQITTAFEGSAFVPPPRTIKDITAILDEQELVDPEKTRQKTAARMLLNPDFTASIFDLESNPVEQVGHRNRRPVHYPRLVLEFQQSLHRGPLE